MNQSIKRNTERTSVTFSAMNVSFTFFYYKNKAFWFSLKSMM